MKTNVIKRDVPEADTYIVPHLDPQSYHIECRKCGARNDYRLPMEVTQWVEMVREFNSDHAKCLSNSEASEAQLCQ